LWENAGGLLAGCGLFRFGEEGQPLNPQIHTVKASAESSFPREQVVQVLQSGYVYRNTILRKAAVVVSRGQEGDWETDAGDTDMGGNAADDTIIDDNEPEGNISEDDTTGGYE
jgi:hypothetical protein